MGDKLSVGPVNKGLRNDVTAFSIDNDSFPVLRNAYQWRGRVKRKRGTSLLTRLSRFFDSTDIAYNTGSTTIVLNGSGAGNLITGFSINVPSPNASIVPGSVIITNTTVAQTYTDPALGGVLVGSIGGSGTINYASGAFTITGGAGNSITATFRYYPALPVMGLEELALISTQFPGTMAFDTKYSYVISANEPYSPHDVSFFKSPSTGSYVGYVQKTDWDPATWNGGDYQQFWTTNFEGALWATNGITAPFSTSNIGMQFSPPADITYVANTATTLDLTILASPLVIGDFVFINEFTGANEVTLNFLTGFVTAAAPNTPGLANKAVTITFIGTAIGAGPYTPGMVQYLTTRKFLTTDGIRWYDGDPTDGNVTSPTLTHGRGWVNFAPPLSRENFSVDFNVALQYYLVGARMIVPFKDRLLFIGPVIGTSGNVKIYLEDTVIYSQNGTPYYTASFTGDPSLATTTFNPILVPSTQTITATPAAYWEDQTGFGGYITAGVAQPIITCGRNRDVLILGFENLQSSFVYTGDDIFPFGFYMTNSELGSSSTFSSIVMDKGILSRGSRGFIMANQQGAERIDLDIPDEVFEISMLKQGTERVTAQRDYINEWIYFTYPVDSDSDEYKFPNQTLQYNYRDNTWAIFIESYTTYGQFRKQTGFTWATVGTIYKTWSEWNVPWNAGSSSLLEPEVIAGNQQGFILVRDDGTGEGVSLQIGTISFASTITGITLGLTTIITVSNSFVYGQTVLITGVVGTTQLNGNSYLIISTTPTTITLAVDSTLFTPYVSGGTVTPPQVIYSPNHTLDSGDYIIISGVLGTVGTQVNGKIFSVSSPKTNGFDLNPSITSGTYLGSGLIKRMYVPFVQTRQFPIAWNMARKTRIGTQQYLLTTTASSEIQLLIFLSQNSASAYNTGPIVPAFGSINNSLIYSTVLKTCPNLPVNNVYSVSIGNVGDGVLTTLNINVNTLLDISNTIVPSSLLITIGLLATFQDNGVGGFTVTGTGVSAGSSINYSTGATVLVFSGAPVSTASTVSMKYYAVNLQSPTAMSQLQTWHRINTSLIGDTVQLGFTMSDAQMREPLLKNQFAEIELHGFIIDVTPSQVLV